MKRLFMVLMIITILMAVLVTPASAAYSGAGAASYARTYAITYHTGYSSYVPNDCANFVSQAVYAGGYPYVWSGYQYSSGWYPGSYKWIMCVNQRSYFANYGYSTYKGSWDYKPSTSYIYPPPLSTNLTLGDIVYYDLTGDGVIDHVSMVTLEWSQGGYSVDNVCAHTNDRYNVPWDLTAYMSDYTIAHCTWYGYDIHS